MGNGGSTTEAEALDPTFWISNIEIDQNVSVWVDPYNDLPSETRKKIYDTVKSTVLMDWDAADSESEELVFRRKVRCNPGSLVYVNLLYRRLKFIARDAKIASDRDQTYRVEFMSTPDPGVDAQCMCRFSTVVTFSKDQ